MNSSVDGMVEEHRTRLLAWTRIVVIAFLYIECMAAFLQQGFAHQISHLEKSVMDLQADPCVDFYRYACGNYSFRHPLQPNQDYVFLTDLQRKDPIVELADYLSLHDGKVTGDKRLQALHAYYTACTEADHHAGDSLYALQPFLSEIDHYKNASDLPKLLARLSSAGSMPFFRISVGVEPDIRPTTLIELLSPSLSLPNPRAYGGSDKESETLRSRFREHVRRELLAFGENQKRARIEADEVFIVEQRLASAVPSPVENRDPRTHIHAYTLTTLNAEFGTFDWSAFFSTLGVNSHDVFNVENPRELADFNSFLHTLSAPAIRAYLRYRLLISIPPVIAPPALAAEAIRYSQVVAGSQPQLSRSNDCLLLTARARQDDLTRLYVQNFLPENLKSDAEAMVNTIRTQLAAEISSAGWLDPQTRDKGMKKLTQLSQVIAYDRLPHNYDSVGVDQGHPLQNYFRATQSNLQDLLGKINTPRELGLSQFLPIASGARYDGEVNTIEIPAADWTTPSFDRQADPSENYARVGFTVGHELIHAFDDEGRQRDGSGKLSDWWTSGDAERFRERSECFVHEYEQFGTDPQHHENGVLTLGENIADNGGLHIALLSFLANALELQEDVDQAQEDGWSPLQHFFLSYAQETCSMVQPESERIQMQTNPHTLDRFRANGVVQNLPQFSRAFSCHEGQPMAPRKRCAIW